MPTVWIDTIVSCVFPRMWLIPSQLFGIQTRVERAELHSFITDLGSWEQVSKILPIYVYVHVYVFANVCLGECLCCL